MEIGKKEKESIKNTILMVTTEESKKSSFDFYEIPPAVVPLLTEFMQSKGKSISYMYKMSTKEHDEFVCFVNDTLKLD